MYTVYAAESAINLRNCVYLCVLWPYATSPARGDSVGHTPVLSRDIAASMPANVPRNVKPFRARIHYRIVFNEVGETIQDLRNLLHVY